jgi:hypothetical protein
MLQQSYCVMSVSLWMRGVDVRLCVYVCMPKRTSERERKREREWDACTVMSWPTVCWWWSWSSTLLMVEPSSFDHQLQQLYYLTTQIIDPVCFGAINQSY